MGGMEAVTFGVLVFVLGTLAVAGAWGVIDAKFAADAAAEAAARTFVEAPAGQDPRVVAGQAASRTWSGYGRTGTPLVTFSANALDRCAPVTVTVRSTVDLVHLPLLGGGGHIGVSASHTEVVDPYRSGLGRSHGDCPTP
jgi:hypothetical protein